MSALDVIVLQAVAEISEWIEAGSAGKPLAPGFPDTTLL